MKKYLLDTNICIHLLHNKYNIKEKIRPVLDYCYISAITLAELYYGAYKSNKVAEELEGVNTITKMFSVIPIDNTVLQKYGQEKARLRKSGTMIDDFDILIGTTAIINDMTLVTETQNT